MMARRQTLTKSLKGNVSAALEIQLRSISGFSSRSRGEAKLPQGGADSAGAQLEVADGADEEADAEGKNILPPELLSPTPLFCLVDLLLQRRGMK